MKSVLITYAALRLLCALLVVAGIYMLAGPAWALIAGGCFALELAEMLRRGLMTPAAGAVQGTPNGR